MPLYEYKCKKCEHLFEKIQNFRARAPKCPECGGGTEKQLSAPAIRFKGTGWYLTDYARKDKGAAADGEKKAKKDDKSAKTAADGGSTKKKTKAGDS